MLWYKWVIIDLTDVYNLQGFFIYSATYLEGSGVAVKKWMQGRLVSLGRIDTMLPVVQKPPESMQMPLGLSLRMEIITSAVTEPETRDNAGQTHSGLLLQQIDIKRRNLVLSYPNHGYYCCLYLLLHRHRHVLREMSKGILGKVGVDHPHHHVAGVAQCLPCSAVWPAPSWQGGSRG